jgi:hypothetical protein
MLGFGLHGLRGSAFVATEVSPATVATAAVKFMVKMPTNSSSLPLT